MIPSERPLALESSGYARASGAAQHTVVVERGVLDPGILGVNMDQPRGELLERAR